MLLLTATSTPLSVTDARHLYRCLDAALKQADKLTLLLNKNKLTKTFLSRCCSLSHSLYRKVLRCTPILGNRNEVFNEVLSHAETVSFTFASKLTFPSRFKKPSKATPPLLPLTQRVRSLKQSLRDVLDTIGKVLAAHTASSRPIVVAKQTEPRSSILEEFFTKAEKDKGWKVQRTSTEKRPEPCSFSEAMLDPFKVGCTLVEELSLPYDKLLDEEVEVGLISFPIVLLEAYKLPDTVLRECSLVAPLHRVFGTYVVLQNATLMGVHRDLMQVVGKADIEEERFTHLIPYLGRNFPRTRSVLKRTFPSGPPRFAKHHYYSPLLPRQLLNNSRFSLGNWGFLTSYSKKGKGHPSIGQRRTL